MDVGCQKPVFRSAAARVLLLRLELFTVAVCFKGNWGSKSKEGKRRGCWLRRGSAVYLCIKLLGKGAEKGVEVLKHWTYT